MWGLSEQVLNSLVNLGVVTHPFWGVGNGVQVMGCRENYSWFVLSHILAFVLCLAWRNPRLLYNDLVKISTVRELP